MGACIVTVATEGYSVMGNREIRFGTVTGSASYATGGDTITAAQLGLVHITRIIMDGATQNSGATADGYIYAPLVASGGTTVLLQAFGDGGNSPGGPLIEAAAATNLTTYTAHYTAYGY